MAATSTPVSVTKTRMRHAGDVRKALVAVAVLAAAVLAGVAVARTQEDPQPLLVQALDTVPDVTLTASFTDWAQVRDVLDRPDISSDSPAALRDALVTAAYEQDLSAASSLVGSVDTMAEEFGWSVLDAEWEMFAQGREGAVSVVALPTSVDLDELSASLQRLGYQRPSSDADDGAVWQGDPDSLARVDPELTAGLAAIAVLADRRLVVASDEAAYAARTVEVITAGSGSLGDLRDVAAVALPLAGDAVAVVHQPPQACDVTSYDTAAELDQRDAAERVQQVGGLVRQRALGFGVRQRSGGLVLDVALVFASQVEALDQAGVRRQLATGDATGQGGTYDERFTVTDQRIEDATVLFELEPVAEQMSLLSDLTTGPLLFSWCGPGSPA